MEEKDYHNEGETYEDIQDPEYYSVLQNSLESYRANLWQIPGFFFAIISLLVGSLDKTIFWSSLFNGIIFMLISVLTGLLLIYYYKAHLHFLVLQKKVDEFDDIYNKNRGKKIERLPLASIEKELLILNLSTLVKKGKLKISGIQYFMVSLRFYMKLLMFAALFISLFLGVWITGSIVYKFFL